MNEGGRQPDEAGSEDSVELLRAKYLDYCSAQLADLLLYLSPDEIFVLSEKVSRSDPGAATAGYSRMVQVATAWLADRVSLPTFEDWVRDYEARPEFYDRSLMGLWESGVPSPAADEPE